MQAKRAASAARMSGATLESLTGEAIRVSWSETSIDIDLSYRGVKAGYDPQLLRDLERAEVLERSDIEMIISTRTLERRLSNRERLRLEESDGIARLLRVLAHANRVFEDEDLAEEWLRSPNPALDDEVPMDMTRTDIGAREVEGVLTRIEHGIFD